MFCSELKNAFETSLVIFCNFPCLLSNSLNPSNLRDFNIRWFILEAKFWGSVWFVEVRFVDKSVDAIKSVADKVPNRNLSTSIFLTEQDQNVIDVLTMLTSFFHDVQWPTVRKGWAKVCERSEHWATLPAERPGIVCSVQNILCWQITSRHFFCYKCLQIARNRESTNCPSTNRYPPNFVNFTLFL